jgi:hypothetical protein
MSDLDVLQIRLVTTTQTIPSSLTMSSRRQRKKKKNNFKGKRAVERNADRAASYVVMGQHMGRQLTRHPDAAHVLWSLFYHGFSESLPAAVFMFMCWSNAISEAKTTSNCIFVGHRRTVLVLSCVLFLLLPSVFFFFSFVLFCFFCCLLVFAVGPLAL